MPSESKIIYMREKKPIIKHNHTHTHTDKKVTTIKNWVHYNEADKMKTNSHSQIIIEIEQTECVRKTFHVQIVLK